MASNAENVSIWWRHHGKYHSRCTAWPVLPAWVLCLQNWCSAFPMENIYKVYTSMKIQNIKAIQVLGCVIFILGISISERTFCIKTGHKWFLLGCWIYVIPIYLRSRLYLFEHEVEQSHVFPENVHSISFGQENNLSHLRNKLLGRCISIPLAIQRIMCVFSLE